MSNQDDENNTVQDSKHKKKINHTSSNSFTKTKKSLQEKFGRIEYALCDEYSMIGKSMLSAFHRALSIANSCHFVNTASQEQLDNAIPFGGVNVIYFGDILQYNPVKDQALYTPVHKLPQKNEETEHNTTTLKDQKITVANNIHLKDSNPNYLEYAIGRSLWLQTKYAIVLNEQMRTIDTRYRDLLNRLRNCQCTKQDHELLLSRVIGSKNCNVKSLEDPDWKDATILVFSNEVRQEINNHTAISRSIENGDLLYVCVAKDVVSIGNNIVPPTCTNILKNILKLTDEKTDDLPGLLPLIPGMPVLLTDNICNQLGLTNGTTGIFEKLIYEHNSDIDASENENLIFPTESTVFVRKPITALVRIPTCNIEGVFEGLPSKTIPIPLVEGRFTVSTNKILNGSVKNFFKKPTQFSVKRVQFPIVPGYAITTYKSQGQTMIKIVIDLVLPPYASKEIATSYVPLSRAQTLDNILILRNFKFESINIPQTFNQKLELENIYKMAQETKTFFAD